MKYKHKKSGIIVWSDYIMGNSKSKCYTNENSDFIPACVVEDSNDWQRIIETPEEVKTLQSIPCLSINDVGKVYITANRNNPNGDMGLEKQGRELIKLVKEKLNK